MSPKFKELTQVRVLMINDKGIMLSVKGERLFHFV